MTTSITSITESEISRVSEDLRARGSLSTHLEHKSLLRACRLRSLVGGCGLHFKARNLCSQSFTEAESVELFALSKEVKGIDRFVSHSWLSRRSDKLFALLVTANMTAATIVSFLVAMIVAVLQSQGILPTKKVLETLTRVEFTYDYFPWTFLIASSAFFIAFRYWHYVPETFGFDKNYFFDKLCVHQSDEDLKAAGILSFAAYVGNAQEFLLFWDINNFSRLWCILELAALVKTKDTQTTTDAHKSLPLTFLPLPLASLSFLGWLLWFLVLLVVMINTSFGLQMPLAPLSVLLCFCAFVGLSLATRQYFRDRSYMGEQLATFQVCEAECALEQDRELVNASMIEWFGSLENFDNHVRTTVRNQVFDTIGGELHWPLMYTMPIFLFRLYLQLDFIACGYWSQFSKTQDNWLSPMFGTASWMVLCMTILPFGMYLARLGRANHDRQWKNVLVILCMSSAHLFYSCALYGLTTNTFLRYFPAFVGVLLFVLSWLWFLWLQRDSFNSWRHYFKTLRANTMPGAEATAAEKTMALEEGTFGGCVSVLPTGDLFSGSGIEQSNAGKANKTESKVETAGVKEEETFGGCCDELPTGDITSGIGIEQSNAGEDNKAEAKVETAVVKEEETFGGCCDELPTGDFTSGIGIEQSNAGEDNKAEVKREPAGVKGTPEHDSAAAANILQPSHPTIAATMIPVGASVPFQDPALPILSGIQITPSSSMCWAMLCHEQEPHDPEINVEILYL